MEIIARMWSRNHAITHGFLPDFLHIYTLKKKLKIHSLVLYYTIPSIWSSIGYWSLHFNECNLVLNLRLSDQSFPRLGISDQTRALMSISVFSSYSQLVNVKLSESRNLIIVEWGPWGFTLWNSNPWWQSLSKGNLNSPHLGKGKQTHDYNY